jgi:ABC-type transport system involved in cytochrome c biogenesis permease subunit
MKKYYNIHTIWLLLVLLTLSTYLFGHYQSSGFSVVLFLIATAIIKSVLIMREFMELRGVSLMWRIIMYGWLTIVCLGIIISYAVSIN